ncbi:MAG: ATP-grasp domain-containing protein [Candidatus Hydrogenedentota bacterium]|nr:MAG: ATP-grasp domain-containing protein [Candidatus Hydrogenedentota bacterium]
MPIIISSGITITMSKKFFISLGAGHHQKPLIQAAKNLGFSVIGVDVNMEAVGLPLCDLVIQESILNYRKIYYKLLRLPVEGEFIGGFAASYGKALLSWAYLAERLSLPALSRTQTELLLNKALVRESLHKVDKKPDSFFQPKFMSPQSIISKQDVEDLGFPLILKGKQGTSKEQVFQLENYTELKIFLKKRNLSQKKLSPSNILLEEKIIGDEITVTGLVDNFQYQLLLITDKIIAAQPPFIELEHRYPSRYEHLKEEIIEIHQWIVDTFQIPLGPLVSEFKVVNDKLFFIELAPQIPGEYIGSFMIPAAIGYDFFTNLVLLFTGQDIQKPSQPKKKKKVRVQYWPQKVPIDSWEDWRLKANFARILNPNPSVPPKSNRDRFGVMGFIE